MIAESEFTKWAVILLEEAFGVTDAGSGFFLDHGRAGILGTLDGISAQAASSALVPGNETIASHSGHILFILNLAAAYERGENPKADWLGSWSNKEVSQEQWVELRARIKAAYEDFIGSVRARQEWAEDSVAGVMIVLTHCAYHLGEIRQIASSLPAQE